MAMSIVFETGSLRGKSWTVPNGGSLAVGRSHTCAIRPSESDVSGRHVVFRDRGGVLHVEVLSSHRTMLNGVRLSAGMIRPLADGATITLGETLGLHVRGNIGGEAETGEIGGETETIPQGRATASAPTGGPTTATAMAATGMFPSVGATTGTFATVGATTGMVATAGAATGTIATAATRAEAEDETQMLATQVVSHEELEQLRGEHLRQQKRRIGIRTLILAGVLGGVFGLYAWLSNPTVNPYLTAPQRIDFPGIIWDGDGKATIVVPYWNRGEYSFHNDSVTRYDSRLGDKWEVPFTIVLTNYLDPESLREDAEASFARWRAANMVGLWRDQGELPTPQFLGGDGGAFPGIRCLQHKYARVDEEGENLVGTATFFRIADRCHVLLRELPAAEDGRGYVWLSEVWTTLNAHAKNRDGSENPFAARHWEGTSEPDDERPPAIVVNDCRQLLESGDAAAWGDVERMLYVTLRTVHNSADPDSEAIRNGAMEALADLRAAQGRFWKDCCSTAFKFANLPGDEGEKYVEAARERARAYYQSQNDERYWIIRQEEWWLAKPVFF